MCYTFGKATYSEFKVYSLPVWELNPWPWRCYLLVSSSVHITAALLY